MGGYHTEVNSPGVAAFIGFAALAKLALLESTGAPVLYTFPFGFQAR